jgi:Leucine-rich repeat (LRR) protein
MRQLKMRFKLIPLIWIVLKAQVLLAAQIDDLKALQRLYQVTDGPRWRNSTNWMSDTSVCTWFGIKCDASSNVQAISLSQNNLVGRVAKLIYRMRHLTQIDMKDNTLRDGDFTGFADVTESNLHLLDLSGNSLTSLKGIGDAPKSLKQLHLTANKLGGPIPLELFGLTQLSELFLSFNHFTGTLPSEIGEMEALEKLYLYGSDLSGNIPTEVGRLQRMRVLTLSENNFTGSLSNDVSRMINLEVFAIHNSQLKKGSLTGPLPWFHKSPFLADLRLDGNSFTGSIPSQLLQVSNLTSSMVTIGLSQNLLIGSLPTSLLKFSSLNLDVTGNRISFVDPLFCQQTSWMIGQVEELGCDALLCPKGTWNMYGRATKVENCTECPSTSSYYGSMACEDNSSQEIKDWLAIGKLYEALDGSSWNETYGWSEFGALLDSTNWVDIDSSSMKYCSWYGVECSDGNTIISLRLSKNGLVGTLPSEVLGMTGLKILDLSLNSMELDITSGLSGLEKAKALSYLDLSGTKISTIKGIANANALSEIYLDSLELPKGSIPSELFTMTSLRTLQMQSSGLAGTIPTEIGKLTRLKR